jgi:repressor LexA
LSIILAGMARTPPGRTRDLVLAFVRDSLERGRSPSIREVQAGVGLQSPEGARQHLIQLVEEGRLERSDGARGWRLPDDATAHTCFVPLLGQVPAGDPTEALEEREGVVPIDARRVRGSSEKLFALRVRGESMRDAAILSGDIVIVDSRAQARHRDIVVARIDEDATVKRLWIARGRAELRPENPAFKPIVPGPGESLEVLGKVIEVRRHF